MEVRRLDRLLPPFVARGSPFAFYFATRSPRSTSASLADCTTRTTSAVQAHDPVQAHVGVGFEGRGKGPGRSFHAFSDEADLKEML